MLFNSNYTKILGVSCVWRQSVQCNLVCTIHFKKAMFFVWIPVNMVHVRSDPMLLWFCEILFHSPQSIKSQKFRIGGAYLRTMDGWLLPVTWNELRVWGTGGSKGKGARVHGPLATWASAQNALNVAIFRLKIEKKFLGRGKCPIPS